MPTVRTRTLLLILALAGLAGGQLASGAEMRAPGVEGRVLGESSPLSSARVYACQLNELTFCKYDVMTDVEGNFRFDELPAGLYKIIAHKAGFLPAIVMLIRTTAQAYQRLEVQLAQDSKLGVTPAGDDFWSIRSRIPSDVLREIQATEIKVAALEAITAPQGLDPSFSRFRTEMQALTGVEQAGAAGEGTLTGGQVGIEGKVGQVQVGLSGRFLQLETGDFTVGSRGGGQASAVSLDVEPGPGSRVNVTSLNNHLILREEGLDLPVGFEHYQVSWSQGYGRNARSEFAAQYTSESNYHRHGWIDPVGIPESSRTWRVEGSYSTALGARSTLETGVRYRERQFGLSGDGIGLVADLPGQERVDFFGNGSIRVQPALLVEYGLYTTLRDGSLSLNPHGGMVLQLGSNWQAEGSFSRRAYEEPTFEGPDFMPSLYQEADLCEEAGEACYEVHLSRRSGDDNVVSFGAVQRRFGDTLRLYFSEDFFDRLESLYLVPGDKLPEAQVTVTRRVAPQVLATFASSVAQGGGGTFYATDSLPYENQVRYVVTSLDTQFDATSTGVFLAFHRLTQGLEPLERGAHSPQEMQLERLQLMLTQDLNFLLQHLAADWAVQLNMELSRGVAPAAASAYDTDDLRKRFVGGLAVRF